MYRLKQFLKLTLLNLRWRKLNAHNKTRVGKYSFDFDNVEVGFRSYGPLNILSASPKPRLIIGNYCSIAEEATFVIHNDHPTNHLSTFPFRVMSLGDSRPEALSKGGIVLDDDVWIGYRATVLDGVHIGRGAVIGAGALVTKDVPPYAIVGGVPAAIIRYRFNSHIIADLQRIDLSNIDDEFVRKHEQLLYTPLEKGDTLEKIKMHLSI